MAMQKLSLCPQQTRPYVLAAQQGPEDQSVLCNSHWFWSVPSPLPRPHLPLQLANVPEASGLFPKDPSKASMASMGSAAICDVCHIIKSNTTDLCVWGIQTARVQNWNLGWQAGCASLSFALAMTVEVSTGVPDRRTAV